MALPSQTERSSEMSRPIMTRTGGRGGPPNKIVLGVVTLVLAAGVVYGIMRLLPSGATGPSNAEAKPSSTVASKPTPPPPVSITPKPTTPAPAATEPTNTPSNPPVVLSQGKPDPVNVLNPNGPAPANPEPSAPPPTTTALPAATSAVSVRAMIDAGDRAFAANHFVEARVSYSRALMSSEIAKPDAEVLRAKLSTINDDLLFSSKVTAGDPLVETYTVASGDSLDRIRRRRDLAIDFHFLARINRLSNPNAIREGQKLKLVRGPFNAIVHKNDFRLDLFAGSPDEPDNWLYIRSFPVGLGAEDSGTPSGTFVVKSKMTNPDWRNPKTGEHFDKDDPKNPIGEYWLGWEGLGDSKVYTGFGLHGTIDPASIGQRKSMGCVRMGAEDIAMVYQMLVEQISIIKVVDDNAPASHAAAPTSTGPIDLTK